MTILNSRCFLSVIAIAALIVGANAATITAEAPGTVFTDREPLRFHLNRIPPEPFRYAVRNFRGTTVASGDWGRDGNLELAPLPPGYYILSAGTEGGECSFVVTVDPAERKPSPENPFALDSAQSWHGGGVKGYPLTAELMRRTGAAMARERLSWASVGQDPRSADGEIGHFNWWSYDISVAEQANRGIRISNVFHDAPAWSRLDGESLPDDLLALYRFGKAAATKFKGQVNAWEFWNEQDAALLPAWDYASGLKAFYCGVKAADPELPVLSGGLAHVPPIPSSEVVLQNDAGAYFDIYNIHVYKGIAEYPSVIGGVRSVLEKYNSSKALWVTENGTNIEGVSEADSTVPGFRAHSPRQELLIAEFIPKTNLALLAAGVARNFFFVLPPYEEREGSKDWGLLRRDWTAKPGYAAFANLTAQLSAARFLGEYSAGAGIRAFVFEQPDGSRTLVYWSLSKVDDGKSDGAPRRFTLPAGGEETLSLCDIFGTPMEIRTNRGKLELTAERYPAYLSGLKRIEPSIPVPDRKIQPGPEVGDKSIVLQVRLSDDFTVAAGGSSVDLKTSPARLTLAVFNLSGREKSGIVTLTGGEAAGLERRITVPAFGKCELPVAVSPRIPEGDSGVDLVFSGTFENQAISRLTLPVRSFQKIIDTAMTRPMPQTGDPSYWRANAAAPMKITRDEKENAVRFETRFPHKTDYWIYPEYLLKLPEESLAGAYAVAFEIKVDPEVKIGQALLMAVPHVEQEGNAGTVFLPYPLPTAEWQEVIVPFEAVDPAGIRMLRLGMNTDGDVTYWVRNMRILFLK